MVDIAVQVIVSPLLGVIFNNLSSPILKEFGLLWGVDKELEKLSNTVSTIRLVLQDAEVKQVNDVATRVWLRKLKDAAYDAEGIMDECATGARLLELDINHKSGTKQVCASFSTCFCFKNIMFRHKIARKIKVVGEKFDEICAERVKFDFRVGVVKKEPNQNRETSSGLFEQVYGRDEDKENIIRFLLNDVTSQNDLSVYPIQGMGGMGKTTVAKLVYNDQRVVEKFEAKIWVCVSEDFDVKRIMGMIIESLSVEGRKFENLDPMQNHLKELLKGKRFLLVLDDVWNENPDKWDKVRMPLTCGAKGSSIIVTTRELKVASIMGTHPAHQLTTLSANDCWSLFKSRAFGVGNKVDGELEVIGKEIVKKCGGLPLAAKALGGSLRCNQDVNMWKFVRDGEIWKLPQDNDGGILPSLRLSYNHLPYHLQDK